MKQNITKKKNRQKNITYLHLVWSHSSVCNMQQSNLSWNGDITDMFLAQIFSLVLVSMASKFTNQQNLAYTQEPHAHGSWLRGYNGYFR